MATERPSGPDEPYLLMIEQQRKTIATLEIPTLQIWDGVLALPLVGSLDAVRAQRLNEVLLQRVVETGSEVAILDLTHASVLDTTAARTVVETIQAARLLGAEVIVVGLSAQSALTIVHLGVDVTSVTTSNTLAKGLAAAFDRIGLQIIERVGPTSPNGVTIT